jgi:hypothetical protein
MLLRRFWTLVLVTALAACGEVQVAQDPSGNGGDIAADAATDAKTDVGGNQAPTIKIKSPGNDAVVSIGQEVHFEAAVVDDNDPPDLLSIVWKTSTGLELQKGKGDASGISAFDTKTLPPGYHKVVCEATDTQGLTSKAEVSLLVNSAPGAPVVQILPANPTTTDELIADITTPASDPDRAASDLTYVYQWLKDDQTTEYTAKTLPAEATAKGQKWTVKVRAKDPKSEGAEGFAAVTIANAAPVAPQLAVTPTSVDLLSDVTCAMIQEAVDADGDPIIYSWSWMLNDYVNPGALAQTASVQDLKSGAAKTAVVKAGDQLRCAVVVKDADSPAQPQVLSSTVVIQPYDVCGDPAANPCDAVASCVNSTSLEPLCTCPEGYSGDGLTCLDVDECLTGTTCSADAACLNGPGVFKCTCKKGFTGDGLVCDDVDECGSGASACGLASDCSNTAGAYVCACQPGYAKAYEVATVLKCTAQNCPAEQKTCQEDADCAAALACGATCADDSCANGCKPSSASGSAAFEGLGKCSVAAGCNDTIGFGCKDVDECKLPDSCSPNATCSNSAGSFSCACKPGFSGDGKTCDDIDECLTNNGGCSADAKCDNYEGGRFCICNSGWVGNGEVCADVDECANGTAQCDPNATCKNNSGSYSCACKAGFAGDGKACNDVDECSGTPPLLACHSQGKCINSQGSAKCECLPGYTGDGKSTCDDIDECKAGTFKCGSNALCVNGPGAYQCVCDKANGYVSGDPYTGCFKNTDPCTVNNGGCAAAPVGICKSSGTTATCSCAVGYSGDGKTCTDVNECLTNNGGCSAAAICTNQPGKFSCACKPGYSGDGKICTDINECANNNGGCAATATCTNLPGSSSCKCNAGYAGDGKVCSDINECLTGNGGCSSAAVCTNTAGSNTCVCKPGFSGDGKTCTDIDECKTNNGGCAVDAICTNTAGSNTCACKPGFSGDGKTCTDINECLTNNGGCAVAATCTNLPGSATCKCNAGYTGDGKTCTDINECPPVFWSWDFAKAGGTGWTFSAPSVAGTAVQWQILAGQLYYGNGTNFDTGPAPNSGTATGPALVLNSAPGHRLSFDLWMDTEPGSYDRVYVQLVLDTGAVVTVWDKTQKFNNQMQKWQTFTAPLVGYAGKKVQVRFLFDTGDGVQNIGKGVQINNLTITPSGTPCDVNAACTNTPGSFTCACDAPMLGDGKKCGMPGSSAEFPAQSCLILQQLLPQSAPGMYWVQPKGGVAAQVYCEYGWQRITLDNFEGGNAGKWQPPAITTCGGYGAILGGYGVGGAGATFKLALSGLPPHSTLRVQGTFFAIDTWDAEKGFLQINGTEAWSYTYSVVPNGQPQMCGEQIYPDPAAGIGAQVPHTAADALLMFGSTLNEGPTNESFGMDNIGVFIQ